MFCKIIRNQLICKVILPYLSISKGVVYKNPNFGAFNFFSSGRSFMDLSSVIQIFEELIPPGLAEGWDNTGLLIEPLNKKPISIICFTNDLTENVLSEARSLNANLIISYHPPIFASIKSLKTSYWKDRIVMQCIENGIAVYSPHTACDVVKGGVNDWLINCFDLSHSKPINQRFELQSSYCHKIDFSISSEINIEEELKLVPKTDVVLTCSKENTNYMQVLVNKNSLVEVVKILSSKDEVSKLSVTNLSPVPLLSHGTGRIGILKNPLTIKECIVLIKKYLKLNHIRFAQGINHSADTQVCTVAVSAGSGSSILKNVVADLYITGEMSHHDVLDINHKNISVVLCEHSNSERGYLLNLIDELHPKLPGIKLVKSSVDKDPVTIV